MIDACWLNDANPQLQKNRRSQDIPISVKFIVVHSLRPKKNVGIVQQKIDWNSYKLSGSALPTQDPRRVVRGLRLCKEQRPRHVWSQILTTSQLVVARLSFHTWALSQKNAPRAHAIGQLQEGMQKQGCSRATPLKNCLSAMFCWVFNKDLAMLKQIVWFHFLQCSTTYCKRYQNIPTGKHMLKYTKKNWKNK